MNKRAVRAGLPRRTVRLRLTAWYGGLFLASGAALLALTYGLVAGAVDSPTVLERAVTTDADPTDGAAGDGPALDAEIGDLRAEAQRIADRQKAAVLRTLLVQSGIALGSMSVISVLLGWLVAGRVLHPLRTITSTARDISATSLHRRLALDGPQDELRELGDTFDALLARLDDAFRAQRQFVANASHELRTPLARQRVLGQVALADPDATVASLRAAHERVLAAGEQQERLIEALLTLARGHAGLDERRPVDLARIVREAVVASAAEATDREVTLCSAIGPAESSGHPALAERLVVNLLDNAIRYNTPGGHVDITTATRHGRAVLEVANTGPDLTREDVERILMPFQRLGAARTARGFGLGLSIVAAVAAAHDADLTAAPRPGGGLHVTIVFPVAATKPR
ncbi:HAMP domain-containing sensor histidine kinase [Glycomyces sp. NPDC047369]